MGQDSRDILEYYERRRREYQRMYDIPERQGELADLKRKFCEWFDGRDVLEIACGTGYWTNCIAAAARSVLATDLSEGVLELARQKSYPKGNVKFAVADAFSLAGVGSDFSAALAGFWFSHVPIGRRREFLVNLHSHLKAGATVVMVDNLYLPGRSSPQAPRRDAEGNTYSVRQLSDGSRWEILKNFPTPAELADALAGVGMAPSYQQGQYYWTLKYQTPP
jgi:demethylmenaquinone methyltransferase/2-methoxy-6-polyprenyl-1,4-benzoquinol methylase